MFSVRITPPARSVASRMTASMPSCFSLHAQESPLMPAPIMMTSAMPRLQRALYEFGERADECRIAVERGNAAEVGHAGFSSDFLEENVQLVQRFDVFGNEADRNDENIRDALLAQPSDHIAGDRKSTRLNSSHTVISYAVFCLKKKK